MEETPPTGAPFDQSVGHRRFVGPAAEYDLMGGLQFGLLLALGLREQHRLLDIGCGSLRAGRLLIPYLDTGRYHGIEPEQWLVEEGITANLGNAIVPLKRPQFAYRDDFALDTFGVRFDFVLAQSILSHTYADLAQLVLTRAGEVLADGGTFVGTMLWRRPALDIHVRRPRGGDGSGWLYPGTVAYSWREWQHLLAAAGLAGTRLPWLHPRQTWFAAVPTAERERLPALEQAAAGALHAPSTAQLVRRRVRRVAYLQLKRWRDARARRRSPAGG